MVDDATRSELEEESSKHRHALDPLSVVFGAIFSLLGALFLFGDIDAATVTTAWAWAALFGTAGLVLIAVGIQRQRR